MPLRLALRSLVARPAYALVVLASIALIVGPGTAVLAVVNATLVRPMPFPDPDQLVQVFSMPPGVTGIANRNPLGSLDFVRFRERATLAEGIAGQWARERALGTDSEPESVPTSAVSSNFFQVLGVAPFRGRTFSEAEDRAGARVAVISYGLWTRRFGAAPNVIGSHVTIDREDHEIIGVMPAGFNPNFVVAEVWTPLAIYEGHIILPIATFVQAVARLRAGVTAAQFDHEISAVMKQVSDESPTSRGGWTTQVASIRDAQFGSTVPGLTMLLAAVIVLALIAGVNLTNLTVAELANRRTEFVLRAALGAGRIDLLTQPLIESALLAAGGGGLGLALAAWSLPAVLRLDPTAVSPFGHVSIDWHVQVTACLLALVVSLTAGGVPVLVSTRGDVAHALVEGSPRMAGSRRRRRMRSMLVAAEMMCAVVLIATGALLLDAFARNAHTDPGFDPHHVLGAELRLSATGYPTDSSRTQLVHDVLTRLRAEPGIVDASTTHNLFIPGFAFITLVNIEGKPSPDGRPYTVQFRRVSPGYFRTMRIAEVEGRTFDDHDTAASVPAVIVSRSLANRYWPGESPVGKRLQRGADLTHWLTVIGVVGDVSDVGFGQPSAPTLYVAYAQNNIVTAPIALVVRTAGDPRDAARTVAQIVHQVDPAQPLSGVTTLDTFLDDSLGPERFRSVLLLVFAAIGLSLAAVGLYGAASRGVAERARELGLRLALGCSPARLRGLVFIQASMGMAAGLGAGIPAAWIAVRLLRHALPGLGGAATASMVTGAAVLVIAGVTAAGIPSLRAGRVDPLTALRSESRLRRFFTMERMEKSLMSRDWRRADAGPGATAGGWDEGARRGNESHA